MVVIKSNGMKLLKAILKNQMKKKAFILNNKYLFFNIMYLLIKAFNSMENINHIDQLL